MSPEDKSKPAWKNKILKKKKKLVSDSQSDRTGDFNYPEQTSEHPYMKRSNYNGSKIGRNMTL